MTVTKRIVPRSEWGARYGRGNDVADRLPWSEVVIHTEAGAMRPRDWEELAGKAADYAALNASLTERQKMQAIERFHAVERGWDGIAYSFFITFDGTVFEGRGWGRSGAHTEGRNSSAAGVCFQGHGDLQPATEAQWASAVWLIGEGIADGQLTSNPLVTGHRQYSTKGKTCPGELIYPQLHRLRRITTSPKLTPEDLDMATAHELAARIDAEANERRAHDKILRAWLEQWVRGRDAILIAWARERLDATDAEVDELVARLDALNAPEAP